MQNKKKKMKIRRNNADLDLEDEALRLAIVSDSLEKKIRENVNNINDNIGDF
ncbi:hypothetical protein [Brachyspira hyodysenteriae]|uniref:hypothetical protein n=1 Tax=Brachyspira hyodysenteriae TaxID=159 RepID=UPI0022CDB258|nr:hypothetical protein [Brachyspira hyodysenteriae]MCZ9948262.1 hypothetical protein [Brachyspira hyodysenteriae]